MPILNNITANAHASGNRISLSWLNPDAIDYPGVKIVRRSDRYPSHPDDGDQVEDVENSTTERVNTEDPQQLKSETVYYYSLFPFRNDPPEYFIDRRNRASAMATAPYGFAELLFKHMPAIYHRFDKSLPSSELDLSLVSDANKQRGQLRRFFELTGGQLDYIYSHISATRNWKNPDRTHGNFLPVMSEWIGWKTDTLLEFDAQRKELKNAPGIYATLGMIPVVESTVKRINNWKSRSKEFVHNVALSNNPERLNLWVRSRQDGNWQEEGEVFSIDHCYEGGISCTEVSPNHYYLFYHTQRNKRWDIWYIEHTEEGWLPSKKLSHRPIIDKETSSTFVDGVLRVFWNGFDTINEQWKVYYCSLIDGSWSTIQELATANQTKLPKVVVINGQLWLFWSEKINNEWRYRYAMAQVNLTDNSILEFPIVTDFPNSGTDSPQVIADVCVAYRSDPSANLYIFWARKSPNNLNTWQVAYRHSDDPNLGVANWSAVHVFEMLAGESIREPHIYIQNNGNPDLYASVNSGDKGWSILSATLDSFDLNPGATTDTWNDLNKIVDGDYSYRAPFYFEADGRELLFYRTNQSLTYESKIYSATEMNDWRYSGTTTVDTRNTNKIQLRGQYEDFQSYSFDTGNNGIRNNQNWYARDTVGIYYQAGTFDVDEIGRKIERLKPILKEFMPLTDRAVFIPEVDQHTEYVYHYSAPSSDEPVYITSTYSDVLLVTDSSSALAEDEDFSVILES